jgi:nitronate monooxygenase
MGIGVSGHRLAGEVAAARAIAGPNGFIAVNVMRALSNSAELVAQACRSGANAACVP